MKCHHDVTKNACHECTKEELSVILDVLVRERRSSNSLVDITEDLRQSLATMTTRADLAETRSKAYARKLESLGVAT